MQKIDGMEKLSRSLAVVCAITFAVSIVRGGFVAGRQPLFLFTLMTHRSNQNVWPQAEIFAKGSTAAPPSRIRKELWKYQMANMVLLCKGFG